MHLDFVNGARAILAMLAISYFVVAVVRCEFQLLQERQGDQVVLLGAELALTLVIFGIVDYPGGYPILWWLILMLIVIRAAHLHRRLVLSASSSREPERAFLDIQH